MEDNVKLLLIRIILASIIFSIVIARDMPETRLHTNLPSPVKSDLYEHTNNGIMMKNRRHSSKVAKETPKKKNTKKSKRDAADYAKYWAARSSNFGYGAYNNNMPPYLVFNRKIGAYFPYYKGNHLRRNSGNVRKSSSQYE